ncbi:hypothetical protein [Streptomyces sp. WAC06614]|uniref:hypothetical protein n=1 Tax=Streptomyces sp. WAC06614 TaxID=2487416 RepID=UPI000F7673CC|nr:hypothetical protein [Streptomyces sp. WAC06614]RSS81486.1 hypothetical protein EF918_10115 [Streptomyces sp. WAC06614]
MKLLGFFDLPDILNGPEWAPCFTRENHQILAGLSPSNLTEAQFGDDIGPAVVGAFRFYCREYLEATTGVCPDAEIEGRINFGPLVGWTEENRNSWSVAQAMDATEEEFSSLYTLFVHAFATRTETSANITWPILSFFDIPPLLHGPGWDEIFTSAHYRVVKDSDLAGLAGGTLELGMGDDAQQIELAFRYYCREYLREVTGGRLDTQTEEIVFFGALNGHPIPVAAGVGVSDDYLRKVYRLFCEAFGRRASALPGGGKREAEVARRTAARDQRDARRREKEAQSAARAKAAEDARQARALREAAAAKERAEAEARAKKEAADREKAAREAKAAAEDRRWWSSWGNVKRQTPAEESPKAAVQRRRAAEQAQADAAAKARRNAQQAEAAARRAAQEARLRAEAEAERAAAKAAQAQEERDRQARRQTERELRRNRRAATQQAAMEVLAAQQKRVQELTSSAIAPSAGREQELLRDAEEARDKASGEVALLELQAKVHRLKRTVRRLDGKGPEAEEQLRLRKEELETTVRAVHKLKNQLGHGVPHIAEPAPPTGAGGSSYAQDERDQARRVFHEIRGNHRTLSTVVDAVLEQLTIGQKDPRAILITQDLEEENDSYLRARALALYPEIRREQVRMGNKKLPLVIDAVLQRLGIEQGAALAEQIKKDLTEKEQSAKMTRAARRAENAEGAPQ